MGEYVRIKTNLKHFASSEFDKIRPETPDLREFFMNYINFSLLSTFKKGYLHRIS